MAATYQAPSRRQLPTRIWGQLPRDPCAKAGRRSVAPCQGEVRARRLHGARTPDPPSQPTAQEVPTHPRPTVPGTQPGQPGPPERPTDLLTGRRLPGGQGGGADVEAEGPVGVELGVVEELVAGALAREGGLLEGVGEQLVRHVRGEQGFGHDQGAVARRGLVLGDREPLGVLDVGHGHRGPGQAGVEPLKDLRGDRGAALPAPGRSGRAG